MKNFEKYIDKIFEHQNYNCGCVFKKVMTDSFYCEETGCKECCEKTKQWLLEEYVEPIRLSHDEYVILKNLDSEYKYIVRNERGDVESYEYKPTKEPYMWFASESFVGELYVFNHLFQFIKWEDEEPYEIAKLIADYEREHEE